MALLAVPRVVPRDGLISTIRLPREVPRGVQLWTGSTVLLESGAASNNSAQIIVEWN